MISRRPHLYCLPLLLLGLGCTGLAASNVGDPPLQSRIEFNRNLALLHVDMPLDSLELLFPAATEAGDAGILRRSRVATADLERVRYSLGWRSNPRHQVGYKDMEDIEVLRATVVAQNGRILRVERMD